MIKEYEIVVMVRRSVKNEFYYKWNCIKRARNKPY